MDFIAFSVHGLVTPLIIFWASTEARRPAYNFLAYWRIILVEWFQDLTRYGINVNG